MARAAKKLSRRTASSPILAKIARPALAAVYARARLFDRLDAARKSPVVWISAPGGAGKTTLVTSYLLARRLPTIWYQIDLGDNDIASFFYYMGLAVKSVAPRYRHPLPLLTREYLAGLPTFTTNYFRELFSRLPAGGVIVFDNYQDVDAEGNVQDVLQWGLEQIPAGANVIVISRQDLPGKLARLRASGRVAQLGWEELKLTEQESLAIVRLRQKETALTSEAMDRLHRDTQGWVAGLVLLTEHPQDVRTHPSPHATATQSIFDYFANEIFRRGQPETQKFLLKTALLPKILTSVARDLTGEKNSAAILQDLMRRNFFTFKHTDDTYEYHPLFREFLLNRIGQTYSAEEIKELKQRAARLLAAGGDIEGAVALLQQAQDWQAATLLIVEQAPTLAEQGRMQTLTTWLQALPSELRSENPWVLYWYGASRLAVDPIEARGYLEKAFMLFNQQQDATPLLLAWSGIIDSFIFEYNDFTPMSRWLDLYPSLGVGRTPPQPKVQAKGIFSYVSGLRYRHPDHPDLIAYVKRAEVLFKEEPNIDQRFAYASTLILCHLWFGDIEKAGNLLDALEPHTRSPTLAPLARLNWHFCVAVHHGGTGEHEAALKTVIDGLALAETSGIHLLDTQLYSYGIYAQLYAGNVTVCRELLQRMSAIVGKGGRSSEAFYRHNASMVLLHEGDNARAVEEARKTVEISRSIGVYTGTTSGLVNLTYAYAAQGNLDLALEANAEAHTLSVRMRSKLFTAFSVFAEANIHRLRGEHERTVASLREALTSLREMGHVTSGACPREDAAALYAIALEAGIETDYVRSILTKTNLPPPRNAPATNWPWQIKIYTLGRFAVLKDNVPLVFSGKMQRKPLELLRMLAVFGARNVSVTKLAQALWPDADGDLARTSFRTTLHRLRKLLGDDKYILLQEGQLTLNSDCCWLDTWEFERSADGTAASYSSTRAQQLLDMYRGPFLEDDDAAAVVIERERLRAKFLQAISQVGETLEPDGEGRAAVTLYEKGIATEPLAEELYRRLMRCYQRLHRPAEALAVYRRCHAALTSALGMEPAAETKRLYEEIRAAGT